MDFFIPGVPLDRVREAGLRLQRGGVGFYPTSGSPFVHMDVGSVRHWPRMTRDQLARVFPGRTHRASAARRQAACGLCPGAGRSLQARSSPSTFEAARIAANDTEAGQSARRLFGFKPKAETRTRRKHAEPAAPDAGRHCRHRADVTIFLPACFRPSQEASRARTSPQPSARASLSASRRRCRKSPGPSPPARRWPVRGHPPRPPHRSPAPSRWPRSRPTTSSSRVAIGTDARDQTTYGEPPVAEASTGSIGPFAAPPGYGEGKPRDSRSVLCGTGYRAGTAPQRAESRHRRRSAPGRGGAQHHHRLQGPPRCADRRAFGTALAASARMAS